MKPDRTRPRHPVKTKLVIVPETPRPTVVWLIQRMSALPPFFVNYAVASARKYDDAIHTANVIAKDAGEEVFDFVGWPVSPVCSACGERKVCE